MTAVVFRTRLLVSTLALGTAYFAWAAAGALGLGQPVAALAALAGGSGLIVLWQLEARLLSRRLQLPVKETAAKIPLSWLPLAVLPFSAPYFSRRVFSPFLAGEPSARRVLTLALCLLLLAAAASVFLKLVLFKRQPGRFLAFLERHAGRILWGGAVIYFAVFVSLAFLAYSRFRYHSDLGQYNQTLWATLRGDFFYSSLEETSGSYLSTHVSPFLLLILPLYALFQSPLTILFLRSLALALAAVPLFYCVRRLTGSGAAALMLAGAFLFHPEIVSQHFTSGYEIVFAVALFFAAFYYFTEGRFRPFVLFLVLALSVREDIIPVAFLFVVYALFKRRRTIWVIVPLAIGVAWQAVVLLIFNATIENWVFNLYYGHFGGSPAEMVKTVITHPLYALEETYRLHKSYLYNLLLPEAFLLPWTSLASIFALPNLATNLARGHDFSAAAGGISHYSVIIVSAMWLGLAGFIGKMRKRYRNAGEGVVAVCVAVVIAALVGSSAHLWFYYLPREKPPDALALGEAIRLIPEEASVSTNDGRVIPRLSARWEIYEPFVWDVVEEPDRLPQGTGHLRQAEFVILKPFGHVYYNDEGTFRFVTEPGSPYQRIYEQDGLRVFRRPLSGAICPLPGGV